jgi:hypothetical protein
MKGKQNRKIHIIPRNQSRSFAHHDDGQQESKPCHRNSQTKDDITKTVYGSKTSRVRKKLGYNLAAARIKMTREK